MPMSDGHPDRSFGLRLVSWATIAAASIGGRIGSKMMESDPGKRTRIRRSTVGQAVLING